MRAPALFRGHEKPHYDALGGVEAFPFDPKLRVRHVKRAEGLDKLCYVPDRGLAKQMYELYWTIDWSKR